MTAKIFRVKSDEYNLDNWAQKSDCAGIALRLVETFGGFVPLIYAANKPHAWTPYNFDKRRAEAKRYAKAEANMLEAMKEFDAARAALKATFSQYGGK